MNNPLMKNCLISSAAAHAVMILLLFSGLFRSTPIRLGTVYGVEYRGNLGGGGGGNGLSAPAPVPAKAPIQKEVKKAEESTWGLKKKKKSRPPVAPPKKQAAPQPAQTTATHALPRTEKTGVEGGQGEGIGIGVGSGAGPGTGAGSGGFPYSWYLLSVKTKLWREWSRWAGSSQPHNCVVTFTIARDGSVGNVSLHQSSGDTFYDQMAVRSVNYAAPFPPLPEGYGSGDLDLYVEFKFLAEN